MNDPQRQRDPLEALTVKEVAEILHVSRPTVEKHIKTGELPSVQIGRCRRVRRVDLQSFLEGRWTYEWQSYRPGATRQEGRRHGPDDDLHESEVIPF